MPLNHATASGPALDPVLAVSAPTLTSVTPDDLQQLRENEDVQAPIARRALGERGLVITDVEVPSIDGTIEMSIVRRAERTPTSPLVYYIHGGGMMLGNRWSGHDVFVEWIDRYDATVATVEYRLAPEFPYPTPHEDCYAGLRWLDEHADALGVRISRAMVTGISAGGGLAAAVTLMARDRGGPRVGAQMLLAPMLDDRDIWPSHDQYPVGVWNRSENRLGWSSLLGAAVGTDDVSAHAAPGRATDHSNLPTTYIEVGSAELFRDESVAFASAIWAAGGQAELHVWAGGFHGFEAHPHTALARGAAAARENWMDRILGFTTRSGR